MERIFKNKKEYYALKNDITYMVIVDERRRHITMFTEEACADCKHFREWDLFCAAYPRGIPDELLDGSEKHKKIRKDQEGTKVFEPKK
jgi:hypothetical protein